MPLECRPAKRPAGGPEFMLPREWHDAPFFNIPDCRTSAIFFLHLKNAVRPDKLWRDQKQFPRTWCIQVSRHITFPQNVRITGIYRDAAHINCIAERNRENRKCRFRGCRLNRSMQHSVESLCRCFKPQGFAWPFVELTRHFVQMSLRVYRHVGAFGEVLSEQAISVLIGTPLPWALRITEVDIDVGPRLNRRWSASSLPRSQVRDL